MECVFDDVDTLEARCVPKEEAKVLRNEHKMMPISLPLLIGIIAAGVVIVIAGLFCIWRYCHTKTEREKDRLARKQTEKIQRQMRRQRRLSRQMGAVPMQMVSSFFG